MRRQRWSAGRVPTGGWSTRGGVVQLSRQIGSELVLQLADMLRRWAVRKVFRKLATVCQLPLNCQDIPVAFHGVKPPSDCHLSYAKWDGRRLNQARGKASCKKPAPEDVS